MTVDELITLLEECDPEAEVRMAIHPSDPFESEIEGVVRGSEVGKEDTVYLVEGDQLGSPPSEVWSLS